MTWWFTCVATMEVTCRFAYSVTGYVNWLVTRQVS
jgi:hypothetical protein